METEVLTCIVTGYGINADYELKEAFKLSGSKAERIHINDIIEKPQLLDEYHILAFPGGFSFGDHLGSGKVFSNLFKRNLKEQLGKFIDDGKLIIGICNGFQVLVKMGLLPNLNGNWEQEVSLIHNLSGKFEDRWVRVKFNEKSPSVWTRGIKQLELPVRHGEGRFVVKSEGILNILKEKNLITMQYTRNSDSGTNDRHNGSSSSHSFNITEEVPYPDNPNGSIENIAGICDKTGRIFGLMPHPEAFLIPENHPQWPRKTPNPSNALIIFKNGVNYIRENIKNRTG